MNNWTEIISSKNKLVDLKVREIWHYRDLIYMFVHKDLVVQYKQTILGPLWYVIQPLITTLMFTVIFGKIARISTDGMPEVLFYLGGLTCWNYFSKSLTTTSNTFIANQGVFGKVYFPRMTIPISVVLSNIIIFLIQFLLFLCFYLYYYFSGADIHITSTIVLLPVLLIMIMGLSLGFGLFFSSFTTKYRDLKFLLAFIVLMWMYATPIIYPLSSIPEKHRWIIALNPMTSIICTFKYSFMGKGIFSWYYLGYSFIFMIVILFIGAVLFNKVEKNFMDTV